MRRLSDSWTDESVVKGRVVQAGDINLEVSSTHTVFKTLGLTEVIQGVTVVERKGKV